MAFFGDFLRLPAGKIILYTAEFAITPLLFLLQIIILIVMFKKLSTMGVSNLVAKNHKTSLNKFNKFKWIVIDFAIVFKSLFSLITHSSSFK